MVYLSLPMINFVNRNSLNETKYYQLLIKLSDLTQKNLILNSLSSIPGV
jgi:hypothetical protein